MMLAAKYQFEAIGTQWSIETHSPLTEAEKEHIAAIITDFTAAYSRFEPQSLVSQLHEDAALVTFPDSIKKIIGYYQQLYLATNGKVNPLVGDSLSQLGYDRTYSLIPHGPAMPAPSLDTLHLHGTTVSLEQPVLLDIGAIGKGYLIDRIAVYIAIHHAEYVIDGSGDMAIATASAQAIGLEHPVDATRVIGQINLVDGRLAASAPNRRSWGDSMHHIIDATTGMSATTPVIATWAVANTAMMADGLATALFFTDPKVLHQYFGDFRYVIMTSNGSVQHNIATIGEIYA